MANGARILARDFNGDGWTVTITAAHAGVPAAAIAEELARAFAVEVHTAGGVHKPIRVTMGDDARDAKTLAELREMYSGKSKDVTLTISTIEGAVIVKTLAGQNVFSVLTSQRFVRMALALAFTDVPLPVEWDAPESS